MSINSIGSSVQNRYPQISTQAGSKNTPTDAVSTPPKMADSLDQIGKDYVQLSPQAIALLEASKAASSATGAGADPARALTLEDRILVGYPDPNDPNVAILAEGISQARETGQLKGSVTEAFLKGGNAQYKFGLFDMLPSDPASLKSSAKTKKAVLDRLHGVQDTKEADFNKMLRKAGLLQTAGKTVAANAVVATESTDEKFDFTNMTPKQMKGVANEMFKQGKIDIDQLFQLENAGVPLGKLGAHGEFVELTAAEREGFMNQPINYVKYTADRVSFLEQTAYSQDSKSGYDMLKSLLGKLKTNFV